MYMRSECQSIYKNRWECGHLYNCERRVLAGIGDESRVRRQADIQNGRREPGVRTSEGFKV